MVLSCPFSQYRGARVQARPVSIPRVPSPASSSSSSSSSTSASAETHHREAVDSTASRAAPSSSSPSAVCEATKAVCASGRGKADELSDVSSCSPSNSDVDGSYCVEAERGKVQALTFFGTLIKNIVDNIWRRHQLALLSLRHYIILSKKSQHRVSSKVLEAPFN